VRRKTAGLVPPSQIFRSNGEILDAQALDDLCARFAD
jgi:hypothetical protein